MTGRKLIRLSQTKEKMATENPEETDWATFVILKKVTPQSANSGKTFSIWKLNDFSDLMRELMALPTFGAPNLKHLAKTKASDVMGSPKSAIQSISAPALLKQQKQQMLEMPKRKSEETQKQFLQSSSDVRSLAVSCSSPQSAAQSLRIGAKFPRLERTTAPRMPKLGTGISEGDAVLFSDESPPPRPKLSSVAEAEKLAAIAKFRAKGQILAKTYPNSIVRKQMNPQEMPDVKEHAENSNMVSAEDELEHDRKKKMREQLAYLESEEFQRILKTKPKHTDILEEAEAELQKSYFEPLVKKEQMEEKTSEK
ncbi:putative protein MCM10 isoform 1 [Cricetulus griseus]|uniref:Replication factor Mcm10 C-terminal domain-containing protein n=1 Tax=Cricetulus griseus TaxID=10029 RepID=A0A061HXP3_CRIGR|nr:putative protein MCM10 isoform 1 [Cricetulus griseus]